MRPGNTGRPVVAIATDVRREKKSMRNKQNDGSFFPAPQGRCAWKEAPRQRINPMPSGPSGTRYPRRAGYQRPIQIDPILFARVLQACR